MPGPAAQPQGTTADLSNVRAGRDVTVSQVTYNNVTINFVASGDGEMDLEANSSIPMRVLEALQDQQREQIRAGVEADIAPPGHAVSSVPQIPAPSGAASPPGPAGMPWSSSREDSGVPPVGLNMSDVAERLAKSWAEVAPQLRKIDELLPGPVIDLVVGDQSVDVADVLIRQGNVALWQFRRAWARFFGNQHIGNILGRLEWPQPPGSLPTAERARSDVEVLRGMVMQQMVAGPLAARPELAAELGRGRWREVLEILEASGELDVEMLRYARTEVEEIGVPYNPGEVAAAFRDAEQALDQALQRQPSNTAALVNMATLLAEQALFTYVVDGVANHDQLANARDLFARGGALLGQGRESADRRELARCLLAASIALPPGADLESVDFAVTYAELQEAAFSRTARERIRWDAVRRNLARIEFWDEGGIRQARDVFADSGETTAAKHCDGMLADLHMFQTHRYQQMQWAQSARPVVGSWIYRIGSQIATANGMIVFNAEGQYHWLHDIVPIGMSASQHISIGNYWVASGVIFLQGWKWDQQAPQPPIPAAPVMPMPFGSQLLVQGVTSDQLALVDPEMYNHYPCSRV